MNLVRQKLPNYQTVKKRFSLTLPKRQILDYSKLKDFADDNFKFEDNGRNFFKRVENTVGKGEIAQCLLFPQWFQKTCTVQT